MITCDEAYGLYFSLLDDVFAYTEGYSCNLLRTTLPVSYLMAFRLIKEARTSSPVSGSSGWDGASCLDCEGFRSGWSCAKFAMP
jgi:hypothetical protein